MSREIKFRIWSYEDKQYRTDCNLTRIFTSMTGTPATVYSDEGDRFDIEQYTGLKDKNGIEIYEGDIVRVGFWDGSYKVLYQVVWRRSDCRFIFENKSREESYPLKEDDSYEVIGNIHESNMEELCPKE